MISEVKEIPMKSWTWAFAGVACMLLLASSAMAQGGELVGAEWGVPGHKVDVTARVRAFIHDGVLQLEVTRFNLGIDPAPHENKVLVVRLREWDGDIKDYSYPERSVARIELDPEDWHARRDEHERHEREERHEEDYEHRERGLQILRAYYGADGQFINVTDAVRSRIDDGRLYLRVDNYSMGGDPMPGVHKRLRILYTIGGERRNIVVDEKTDLQLP
jgi:DnaJ-like protein